MIQLDSYATLVAATLVLLLGRLLVNRIGPLRTFNIPKPVAGGLVVALVLLLLRSTMQLELQFDTTLQTPLMLAFFASIGLSADLGSLKRGGKAVITFLLVVTGLLLVQGANAVKGDLSVKVGGKTFTDIESANARGDLCNAAASVNRSA